MLDFFRLARLNAGGGEEPWAKGFLLPLKTIFSLLAISALITMGWWLWVGALNTVTFGVTAGGVALTALLNHWFARDFFTASLATREVSDKFDFGKKNSTALNKLVDHAVAELNLYFGDKYKEAHEDIPTIGILTFAKSDFEIFSFGRSPKNAAIFLSSGVFDYEKNGMNQRHVLTLIQMELIKLYLMRHRSSLLMSIGINFLTTLEMLADKDAWQGVFRVLPSVLGVLSSIRFFMLFQYALERAFAYEAARIIVQLGRGFDLVEAYDKKVCPHLIKKPTKQGLRRLQQENRREPYVYKGNFQGSLGRILKSLADFIDKHEYARNYKGESRWWSLPEILVREFTFFISELWSKNPRSTNLCGDIRPLITDGEISLDTAKDQKDIDRIKKADWARNQLYYDRIKEEMRYDPVGPGRDGYRPRDRVGNKNLSIYKGRESQEVRESQREEGSLFFSPRRSPRLASHASPMQPRDRQSKREKGTSTAFQSRRKYSY